MRRGKLRRQRRCAEIACERVVTSLQSPDISCVRLRKQSFTVEKKQAHALDLCALLKSGTGEGIVFDESLSFSSCGHLQHYQPTFKHAVVLFENCSAHDELALEGCEVRKVRGPVRIPDGLASWLVQHQDGIRHPRPVTGPLSCAEHGYSCQRGSKLQTLTTSVRARHISSFEIAYSEC